MAAREPLPLQAAPYEWNDAEPPPTETLNQWIEVGNGIDKSQTGTTMAFAVIAGVHTMFGASRGSAWCLRVPQ